ncbi:hypothetical protein [Caulobacter sp. NIBR2454]|uniref:hypothetical protein n=1 Tax=Caulobacter sp. NIBR2454 TaxID=3015996 RepID=UPI0022B7414B|nr:hypothetical protein [Caulobacter sp. NIBR2454]
MSAAQPEITADVVAAVLKALTGEMAIASQSCGALDDALGRILEATPVEGRMAVMQELHTVDMLAQRVTAMADFSNKLSQSLAQSGTLDVQAALSTITLGEVADRMRASIETKAV